MSSDDRYRRDEQRRADLRTDERRQDRLREERRREVLREERRREERRHEALRDEELRRQRAADEQAQDENRKRGMGLIEDGFPIWGAAVLGLDPQRTRPEPNGGTTPAVRPVPGRAADWWNVPDRAQPQQLAAPVLLRFDDVLTGRRRLSWTAVAGATAYVLQKGLGTAFALATEIYRGERTEHIVEHGLGVGGRAQFRLSLARSALEPRYRVQAIAGPGSVDSPWSSVA